MTTWFFGASREVDWDDYATTIENYREFCKEVSLFDEQEIEERLGDSEFFYKVHVLIALHDDSHPININPLHIPSKIIRAYARVTVHKSNIARQAEPTKKDKNSRDSMRLSIYWEIFKRRDKGENAELIYDEIAKREFKSSSTIRRDYERFLKSNTPKALRFKKTFEVAIEKGNELKFLSDETSVYGRGKFYD